MTSEHHLDLVQSFVNTVSIEDGTDEFSTPQAMRAWLAGRGLIEPGARVTTRDLWRVIEVREAIRALAEANNRAALDRSAVATLQAASERAAVRPRFLEDGSMRFEPVRSGVDRALALVFSAMWSAMADGTWSRLKTCSRASCRWVFYDRSRNRSGAWCSMAVCGNRTKVQRYRVREFERRRTRAAGERTIRSSSAARRSAP